MYKDYLGTEVNVGDQIAYLNPAYRSQFFIGTITSFTKTGMPRTCNKKSWTGRDEGDKEYPILTPFLKYGENK